MLIPESISGYALQYSEIKWFIINPSRRSSVGRALRKVACFSLLCI